MEDNMLDNSYDNEDDGRRKMIRSDGVRSPTTENTLLRARLKDYTEKMTDLNLLLRRYEGKYKEQQAKAEEYEGQLLSSANYIEKVEDQLRKFKQGERQTKRQIRIDYEWDGEEANLSDKVSNWVKVYLFARYKFLKDGWWLDGVFRGRHQLIIIRPD